MSSLGFPWLCCVLALPLAAAAAGALPIDAERYRRLVVSAACVLCFLCVALLYAASGSGGAAMTDPWDPGTRIGGAALFRIDRFSGVLLPFASLLWVLAVGVTPRRALDRHGIRRTALATAVTLATFLTESPGVLAACWVLSILIFLRALAAGGYRRALRVASVYLLASSVLLVAGVAGLALRPGDSRVSGAASVCILLAVMIRKGIFPLHGWLPEAFEHGRIGPAVLFSAPQIGAYAAVVLLLPRAPASLLTATGLLALVTAVYGAVAAVAQSDARRAFGYIFISQSALVMAGLECVSVGGLAGGLSLWLSSGIAFAALARCLAVLEARRGRLSLDRLNGGYERMPLLASSFLLTALASIGFPGTLGFVSHELLVGGTVAQFPRTGFLVVAATALGGVALLRIYFSLFCGRQDRGPSMALRPREAVLFASFSALLLIGGLAPQAIIASRAEAAARILERRAGSAMPAGSRDHAPLRHREGRSASPPAAP